MKAFRKRVLSLLLLLAMAATMLPPSKVDAVVVVGSGGEIIKGDLKTGTGGGIPDTATENPIFAVGFSNEDFGSDAPADGSEKKLKDAIIANYKNHIASSDDAVYFAPPGSYQFRDQAGLSWYNAGSGSLCYLRGEDFTYKFRPLGGANSNYLWYDQLYSKINTSKEKKKIALAKGAWKSIAGGADKTSQALAVWGWILQDNAKYIDGRLNQFLRKTDEEAADQDTLNQQAAAWVDLMISLWQLMQPGSPSKANYEVEIERYLTDDNLLKRPPSIVVSTAVIIHAPRYTPPYIVVRSVDYLSYLTGVTAKASFYVKNSPARGTRDYTKDGGHLAMIEDTINYSLKDLPNRERLSNKTIQEGRSNAFVFGQGIVDARLHKTGSGKLQWGTSSVHDGFMKALKFSDELYGFLVAVPSSLEIPIPSGRFGIRTNAPETTVIPETSPAIGENVNVTLDMVQTGYELSAFEKKLARELPEGYPKIKVDLRRTEPSNRQADTTTPPPTAVNPYFSTSSVWKGNAGWIPVPRAELLNQIKGAVPGIVYCDETASYPIDPGSTVTFSYSASVEIQLGPKADDAITLTPDPGTAKKIFKRPVPEPELKGSYISEPSYWSEIKNGSPGNETFEAMAGVPTTRDLYFASGGSEFIVEAEFEYVKDTEITRTYRSYFTGGVDSEFKAGDNAGTKSLGGLDVDMHNGGTYTKTWTGTTSWTGSGGVSGASAWVSDSWDDSSYNAAVSEANAFVSEVNGTTLSFRAASDGQNRSHTGWNARITTSSNNHNSGSATQGQEYIAPTPPSGNPPTGGSPGQPFIAGKYTPGTSNSWTVVVTWNVPAHIICGPCCCHVLPGIEDTWTQKIKFDHMKVNVARVWKLDKSAVDGMVDITGTDEFKATVVQGDPTVFYNRSELNKSIDGRLRYSLEPDQHDTVVWNEGPRSNKEDGKASNSVSALNGHASVCATGITYTNSSYSNEKDYEVTNSDETDKLTTEYARFKQRRETPNTATVISDFLILQTSSGDQSIMYFQKDSTQKQAQENFDKVAAAKEEMWENNPLSFARKQPDAINIGSYNGRFYTPAIKYSSYASSPVITKFDTVPAGMVRPPRPSAAFRLMKTGIDIIDTLPNGAYRTGESTVFYTNVLNYGPGTPAYAISYNSHYGAVGADFTSTYSDTHTKVNDIVVHDPVSAEFSMVIPLESSRDQRTAGSQLLGGNLQEAVTETVRRLKDPTPRQNLIWNGDAETVDAKNLLGNWNTWESVPGKSTFTRRAAADWKINGTGSFEIVTEPNNNYVGVYYTDVPGIPGDSYSFTGKLGAHRCQGYFAVQALSASYASLGWFQSAAVDNNANIQNLSFNFTAPPDTAILRVQIINGNTSGYVPGYAEYVFADDLVLNDNTTTTWQPVSYTVNEYTTVPNPYYVAPYYIANPSYVPEHTIPNPDYVPANPGTNQTFSYTGNYQTFTAPAAGTYTIEAWGAQGAGNGGYGGYAKGDVVLSANQTVYVYVGGSNGWNGGGPGGSGASPGFSGGGASDVRAGGTGIADRVIAAGGGGGSGGSSNGGSPNSIGAAPGGAGGAAHGGAGETYGSGYPGQGGYGATETAGGYGGSGGSYQSSSSSDGTYYQAGGGGGGGGYYGGGGGGSGSIYGSGSNTGGNAGGTGSAGQGGSGGNSTYTYGRSGYYSWPGGGGGAGSGYIGGVSNGSLGSAARAGNGCVSITSPAIAAVGAPVIYVPAVDTPSFLVNNSQYSPAGPTTAVAWKNAAGVTVNGNNLTMAGSPWAAGAASNQTVGNRQYMETTAAGTNSPRMIGLSRSDTDRSYASIEYAWYFEWGQNLQIYESGVYVGSFGTFNPGDNFRIAVENGNIVYYKNLTSVRTVPYTGSSTFLVDTSLYQTGGVLADVKVSGAPSSGGAPYDPAASATIQTILPTVRTMTSAPEDWYETTVITIPPAAPVTIPSGGTFTPGNFINLDYGFRIYFPNIGNFRGDNSYGLANLTKMRGRGFVNGMDTTEWTKEKYARFEFNVIYNEVAYRSGTDIPLDVHDADGIYDFYCPLANAEAVSAEVVFTVLAINGSGIDNTLPANKERMNLFDAKHSGVRAFNVDVAGRIGNMIMEDTGDFRFSNLFKQPKIPESWIIQNVLAEVDISRQNRIAGSRRDIRGAEACEENHYLNTYGLLEFADSEPVDFPLTPDTDKIPLPLRNQPLRPGYKNYMDIQTIGNYAMGGIQIIPYYYRLDLHTGLTKQLDVYMNADGAYKPVNIFGAAVPGWDPSSVYDYATTLDWEEEAARRNYTPGEEARTEAVAAEYPVPDIDGNEMAMPTPLGKNHTYGNGQLLQLNNRNRTFIGTSTLYGQYDENPGGVFPELFFGLQAQRWHFTTGLPSSAVAVEHGRQLTQANIDSVKSNTSVILMALDIKAIGDTYVLQYSGSGENGSVRIAGNTYNLSSIPYPILCVISSNKTSADDLSVTGTH